MSNLNQTIITNKDRYNYPSKYSSCVCLRLVLYVELDLLIDDELAQQLKTGNKVHI